MSIPAVPRGKGNGKEIIMKKWSRKTKAAAAFLAAALAFSAFPAFAEEEEETTEAAEQEEKTLDELMYEALDWEPGEVTYPVTISVDGEEDIVIESEPQTIVSMGPNMTEIIYAVGAGDRLIGRTDYCNYPEEVFEVESIGSIYDADVEHILALEPDLVLASTHAWEENVAQLQDAGVTILFLHEEDELLGVLDMIHTVGTALNCEEKAMEVMIDLCLDITLSQVCVEDAEPVSVYYVISYGEYGDYTAGGDTFIGKLIELAGGDNIAKDVEGWGYSVETLLEKDPEIILVPNYAYDDFIVTEPYTELTAVKEGRVYGVDNDKLDRQGPRNGEALLELVELIHPETLDKLEELESAEAETAEAEIAE